MKKTVTTKVWASDAQELPRIYDMENEGIQSGCVFVDHDMTDSDWIQIGTAVIEMTLIEPADTVAAQVSSLEAQIKSAQAQAEKTITILRSRINDLLAIEGK